MQRGATKSNDRVVTKPNVFNPVFNKNRKRVRGLWIRNGVFYAQVRIADQVKQVPLHDATTIAQAIRERQALKSRIAKGEYPPKPEPPEPVQPPETTLSTQPPTTTQPSQAQPEHTIPEAIEGYRKDRDLLKKGDPATRARENSGLNAWLAYCSYRAQQKPPLPVLIGCLDSKMLKYFAVWRREKAIDKLEAELEEGETLDESEEGISGRTLDLNIQHIEKVIDWAVVEKWLPVKPVLEWETLATEPEKIRLLTPKEMLSFARANLVTAEVLNSIPKKYRHLRARQAKTARSFCDFVKLVFYSGGREQETLRQRWANVVWSRVADKDENGWKAGQIIRGHVHFPGEEAKAGGGKPAEDRNVDFHEKLEAHLKDMYQRRDKTTDWMFPSIYDFLVPQGSFRTQLEHARELTGQPDVAFHHGRHYFISHAVMAGVDFRTIAYWVSHRDGGKLIGRKYSHLSPGHSKLSAQRLDSAF
jgi:integrase